MGLKVSNLRIWRYSKRMIKSDQNGIESVVNQRQLFVHLFSDKIRPKWDWKHKKLNNSQFECFTNDKIRPKWDWKEKWTPVVYYIQCGIKSDQNGIERKFCLGNFARLYKIKSDQNGIERFLPTCSNPTWVLRDKIRPKWDWKVRFRRAFRLSLLRDKIRPKWDWKFFP